MWRVAGGDSFDFILAYLYIFVMQLANSTINTIPFAQNDESNAYEDFFNGSISDTLPPVTRESSS